MTAVQLLIGLLTLVVNAFFVGAEFALISVRRSQIEPHAEAGRPAGAQRAVGPGARVGADGGRPARHHAVHAGARRRSPSPPSRICWSRCSTRWACPTALVHAVSFVIALALATYLHMLLGEMVPKNIALAEPVRTALLLGPPLVALARALRPVIFAVNAFANALLKLLRVETKDEVAATFSDDELARLVQDSGEAGLHRRPGAASGCTTRWSWAAGRCATWCSRWSASSTRAWASRRRSWSGCRPSPASPASRWSTRGAGSSAICTSRTRWTRRRGTCRSRCRDMRPIARVRAEHPAGRRPDRDAAQPYASGGGAWARTGGWPGW